MGTVSRLARKMPGPVQRFYYAAVPFSIRYGAGFRKTCRFIEGSQWWDRRRLEAYQLEQLGRLLEHAYRNVPYYQRVFDERRLKPKDIQTVHDLRRLPILTRDIVRENFNDLMARNTPASSTVKFSTSGSTGKPLTFLGTDYMYKAEAAFITRAFRAHGTRL